ncbi:hypothetical protein B0H14DRAFT_2602040 [Mycena olivaceomarginata]|nr:hypothetical protein B0H14DRAFT_2602040 [Mycena olivaceomarginata]
METRKCVLGEDYPSTLTSVANHVSTYGNQGRWKDAEGLVVVMETMRRVLGGEYPSTLMSMANLAATYGNQGRWKDAEALQVVVMETTKHVLRKSIQTPLRAWPISWPPIRTRATGRTPRRWGGARLGMLSES